MRISDLSVAILREVSEPIDNRQQCALVVLTAEDGTVGYGEANANPAAVKALLDTDLGLRGNWDDAPRRNLLDSDATDPRELWKRLKDWSFWSCRAGLGHVALAAVGTAAWDLAGKLAGKPTYELLGPLQNPQPLAYCTLYHGGGDFRDTVAKTLKAVDSVLEAGFQAAKVEPLPDNAPDPDDIVELVRLVRERVGDDFLLLADVGYRWHNADEAIPIALQLDEFGLYALEAPFPRTTWTPTGPLLPPSQHRSAPATSSQLPWSTCRYWNRAPCSSCRAGPPVPVSTTWISWPSAPASWARVSCRGAGWPQDSRSPQICTCRLCRTTFR